MAVDGDRLGVEAGQVEGPEGRVAGPLFEEGEAEAGVEVADHGVFGRGEVAADEAADSAGAGLFGEEG